LQGKNVRTAQTDTPLSRLQEQRAFLCRLTPDRALETLDEAEEFLRERGMLTRTTDCSLPSLFEACHEEPYAPDKPGFGQWPRTKWGWSFALARRPGVYATKVHHRGKTLYVSADVARVLDPIIRAEIGRMGEEEDWALVLDHLAAAGPSTSDDLRTELGLKPKELKKLLAPLELCGTVVVRAIEPDEEGMVEGFEYARWDQIYTEAAPGDGRLDDFVVASVRAAVVATEREVPRWFAWRWRLDADLLERVVSEGRLERPEPGWVAAPGFE
jgi:TFIIE alpha subunit